MVKRPTTRGILLGGMPFLAGCVLWAGVHFGVGGPAAGRGKEIFEQEQGNLWARITSPAAGALVSGQTPVSMEVGPGINRVEFEPEGGTVMTVVSPPFGWVWDTRSGPDGVGRLTIRAYGAGGAPATTEVSVTVDNAAPRLSLAPLSTPLTAASTVEVSATAEDVSGVARLVFSLDGTPQKTVTAPPFVWSWAVGAEANGSHRVTADAYDRAGNRATTDVSLAVAIDNQNPAVSLSIPGVGATLVENQTLSITAAASDNVGVAKVWFILDDVVVATVTAGSPYVYNWTISSSNNGIHRWTATAFDAMGNQATTPPVSVAVNIPVPPGSDRTSQTYLFQMVRQPYPSTLGGAAYSTDWRGPTADYVDAYGGWRWTNRKGDWIDATGTPQGNQPFVSFNANSGNPNQFFTYAGIDATALVQYVQAHGMWLAVLMDSVGMGERSVASNWNQTVAVPSIVVNYVDGSGGTLACKLVAADTTGSDLPHTLWNEVNLPAFLEFERPAKPVTRATLTLSLKNLSSGTCVVRLNPCHPPLNTDPVTGQDGLASLAGNLDQGITALPSVIGAQRYVDGSSLSDFVYGTVMNNNAEYNYDPALWGGAHDFTKFPHVCVGKWTSPFDQLTLVTSDYTGEGFAPLAPGLGAMKLDMRDAGVQTGQEGWTNGTAVNSSYLFMPYEEIGVLDHIFVRQYIRLGSPHVRVPSDRREVLRDGLPAWTDMAGKFGISPSHDTTYGGFSGTSGGSGGWQMRWSWSDCEVNLGGPNEQGVQMGWHLWDYGSNPAGYNHILENQAVNNWGQRGGLAATFYPGRWYCIETEVKLNSIDTSNPNMNFQADGLLRTWVDGRLVYERTGLVFRTWPVYRPAYNPEAKRPIRQLGIGWLLWNWYHGGTTPSSVHRTTFTTGLVWAKQRIGPMKRP